MSGTAGLRWGIIGPGGIARAFAAGLARAGNGHLVAIASRDPGRPGLAEAFPGARIHDGYEALLADPGIDAVYIANLHPWHARWAIRAAEAGKHALVEKPIGMNVAETEAMIAAARKAGTFLGEAFMYRFHPQTRALVDLVAGGRIGEVRLIQSSFGFRLPFDAGHRLFAHSLGGGAILDVGGYPVSMLRLIAGAAAGKPFLDPVEVTGMACIGAERTDEYAVAQLRFDNGIIAQASGAIAVPLDNVLRIHGTEGRIEVQDFWFASGRQGGVGRIDIVRGDDVETVEIDEPRWLYSFEAEAVGDAIAAGRQQFAAPGMDWADSLGNMRVLDKWRADIGLRYDFEPAAA